MSYVRDSSFGHVPAEVLRRLRVRTGLWPGTRVSEGSLLMKLHSGEAPGAIFWCVQSTEDAISVNKLPSSERSVYVFSSPNRLSVNDERFIGNSDGLTKSLAAYYVKEIQRIQATGPYILAGQCSGAEIVYEIAQQLNTMGFEVDCLVLVEPVPLFEVGRFLHALMGWLFLRRQALVYHAKRLWALPLKDGSGYICRLSGNYLHRLWQLLSLWLRSSGTSIALRAKSSRNHPEKGRYCFVRRPEGVRVFRGSLGDYAAAHGSPYILAPYPGRVTVIFGCSSDLAFQRVKVLRPYVESFWKQRALGGLEFHTIPGRHDLMTTKEGREALGYELIKGIERSRYRGASAEDA